MLGFPNLTPSPYILSVQQVSINILTNTTSNTATITAVSANAFIIFQGFTGTNGAFSASTDLVRAELTNSTTVTVNRDSSSVKSLIVNALIIDPTAALVSSVQAGNITITAGTTNTATISSVDLTRSAVFYLGQTSTGAGIAISYNGVTLTNATTVTANLNSTGTTTVGYIVVQFAAAAIKSIQQFANAFTGTAAANTQTITSVNTANSMIAYGGETIAVSGSLYWYTLTDSTTVTLTRNGTATGSRTPYYTVIEFVSGVLRSLQRGSIALVSVTSNTATVSSVNTSLSACNFTGFLAGDTQQRQAFPKITLTNSTTITATRDTLTVNADTAGYELLDFS